MREWIKNIKDILANEEGTALLMSMLMLIILTFLGMASLMSTDTDLQISGNKKSHTRTFYAADSGVEAGLGILEETINSGYTPATGSPITINTTEFYLNKEIEPTAPASDNSDITLSGIGGSDVYLRIYGGETTLSPGSGIQIGAGYEGKGKGAAGGGAYIIYNIRSLAASNDNSQSKVRLQWRHVF
ncbi:MAG: hypothetical protein V1872_06145 [bacterium]